LDRAEGCVLAGHDFNGLERRASVLLANGRTQDAIKVYLFMADDDRSLDGGYLGEKLGQCYELLGDLHAARYWYGRAVEENPAARGTSMAARERLSHVTIDALLGEEF
jgi:tetratricopeptide (TPR) repeat protein